jgi:hypothetical protein
MDAPDFAQQFGQLYREFYREFYRELYRLAVRRVSDGREPLSAEICDAVRALWARTG